MDSPVVYYHGRQCSCASGKPKRVFNSFDEAMDHVMRRKPSDNRIHTYTCPICGNWHCARNERATA